MSIGFRISGQILGALGALLPALAGAQGHGPIFGLSTPTLPQGAWSLDAGFMNGRTGRKEMLMFRPALSYGATENLMLTASIPVPLYMSEGMRAERVATRMPATPDMELTAGWRFQHRELGVGSRFETTAYLTAGYPTDRERDGVRTSPGLAAALATGYVSRSVYVWLGGLYHRDMTPIGPTADHIGDVAIYSAVIGYRPPQLQREYPHPDWRIFVEALNEHMAQSLVTGVRQGSTGGQRTLVGPTLLGLFGSWGVSGGVLFPVVQKLNGAQEKERHRGALDLIFWF